MIRNIVQFLTISAVAATAVAQIRPVPSSTGISGRNDIFKWFTIKAVPALGGFNITEPRAINSNHTIAGFYWEGSTCGGSAPQEHAFLTSDNGARVYAYDVPGALFTIFAGINDNNIAVGTYANDCNGTQSGMFTLDLKQTPPALTSLRLPGTAPAPFVTNPVTVTQPIAEGINNNGDVIGDFAGCKDRQSDPQCNEIHYYGFILKHDNTFTALDACTGLTRTVGGCQPGTTSTSAINDRGMVVGHYTGLDSLFKGFIYDSVSQTYMQVFCNGDLRTDTSILGINNQGTIVGECSNEAFYAFPPYGPDAWHRFTVPLTCPTSGTQPEASAALGISNDNQITGIALCTGNGVEAVAFTTALNDLIGTQPNPRAPSAVRGSALSGSGDTGLGRAITRPIGGLLGPRSAGSRNLRPPQ